MPPKSPDLIDVDVYSRDYPGRITVPDMARRQRIQKRQLVQLIFPTYNKRGWVRVLGWMDGGIVGELQGDIGQGLGTGDRILFQYRHIYAIG